MKVLAVFRQGKWIQYSPRCVITADPRISDTLQQLAASVYVTALQKGFQEEKAHVLAEATVFKSLYSDLMYDHALESDLKKLMDRGGKA
jgi:hypothetical protein